MFKRRLKCSFCGKGEDEIAKLVAGAAAYICNECAAMANTIMNSSDPLPGAPSRQPGIVQRTIKRIFVPSGPHMRNTAAV
jgi:ATP-dependent protease Clp ATPase subunit